MEAVITRHIKEASEQAPMAKTALLTQGKHKWSQEVFNLTVSKPFPVSLGWLPLLPNLSQCSLVTVFIAEISWGLSVLRLQLSPGPVSFNHQRAHEFQSTLELWLHFTTTLKSMNWPKPPKIQNTRGPEWEPCLSLSAELPTVFFTSRQSQNRAGELRLAGWLWCYAQLTTWKGFD